MKLKSKEIDKTIEEKTFDLNLERIFLSQFSRHGMLVYSRQPIEIFGNIDTQMVVFFQEMDELETIIGVLCFLK